MSSWRASSRFVWPKHSMTQKSTSVWLRLALCRVALCTLFAPNVFLSFPRRAFLDMDRPGLLQAPGRATHTAWSLHSAAGGQSIRIHLDCLGPTLRGVKVSGGSDSRHAGSIELVFWGCKTEGKYFQVVTLLLLTLTKLLPSFDESVFARGLMEGGWVPASGPGAGGGPEEHQHTYLKHADPDCASAIVEVCLPGMWGNTPTVYPPPPKKNVVQLILRVCYQNHYQGGGVYAIRIIVHNLA